MSLDTILADFTCAVNLGQLPIGAIVAAYARRYPEHQRAISEHAVALIHRQR